MRRACGRGGSVVQQGVEGVELVLEVLDLVLDGGLLHRGQLSQGTLHELGVLVLLPLLVLMLRVLVLVLPLLLVWVLVLVLLHLVWVLVWQMLVQHLLLPEVCAVMLIELLALLDLVVLLVRRPLLLLPRALLLQEPTIVLLILWWVHALGVPLSGARPLVPPRALEGVRLPDLVQQGGVPQNGLLQGPWLRLRLRVHEELPGCVGPRDGAESSLRCALDLPQHHRRLVACRS